MFAVGSACLEDSDCSTGICDITTLTCVTQEGLCGNSKCDRDRGESLTSCPQDCNLGALIAAGDLFSDMRLRIIFIIFAVSSLIVFLGKKEEKKKNTRRPKRPGIR